MNNKGITIINLVLLIAILSVIVVGGVFGIYTMINNNKVDNFINASKEYVEGAKKQLMSDNMMPSGGEGMIVPYSEINLGKEYNSSYGGSFQEDYSYVVVIKDFENNYKYFVTQLDNNGYCINMTDYENVKNFGKEKRQYINEKNECKVDSILYVDNNFKLSNIDVGFDVKYYKYQKNV